MLAYTRSMLYDPIKYGFAVGRIKVLETRLFDKHWVGRMVEAENLQTQLRILAETDYGRFFEDVKTLEDVDEALHRYLANVYDFLEEISPNPVLIAFFRLRYDFHNLKVLLKAKYKAEGAERIWSRLGPLDVEEARDAIEAGEVERLPKTYRNFVREAMESFEEEKDAQRIDIILDRGLFERWYQLALSQKNQFLGDFVRYSIDLANLKIFFRARGLGREKDFIVRSLIDHGTLKKEELIALHEEPLEKLVYWLRDTHFARFLKAIMKGENVDLSLLDREADNFLLAHAKAAKLVPVGIEPIVGYILAKENEVNVVRIILAGRLSGLSRDQIRGRVRELYV